MKLSKRIESAEARATAQAAAKEPIFLFEENLSGNRLGKPGDSNNVYYANWLEVYSQGADGKPHLEKDILEFTERDHPSQDVPNKLQDFYDAFRQKHPDRQVVILELEFRSKKPIAERMNDALDQYKTRDEKNLGGER